LWVSGPVWAGLGKSELVWAGLGWSGPVLGFWCGCRFLGRYGLVWAGLGWSGPVPPAGRVASVKTFGKLCELQKTEKKLAGRPVGLISDLY
jgi:hypothetical protein